MFQPVSSSVNFPQMEQEILRLWRAQNAFQKSLERRQNAPRYVFYEGPPTANGRPGAHHVLARVFKDLFPRYKTMRGYYVLRKGGWDTHGLPVELEVEQELGITSKKEIEDYGIERFNQRCRESVFRYVEDWVRMTERIGFWIDMENAYVTLHNEYIESLWWILKQLWERDLIYQGYKVVPYCPRCGTPLSSHELALGYKEGTKDPSVYVKFPLRDDPGTYFLVWTTTPWTLPGNVALAVGEDITYVEVELKDEDGQSERLILAEARLDALDDDYKVVRHMKGKALVGKHYKPLYTFLPVEGVDYAYVVAGDFVSTEEGTGIVHIAPAFGADDMKMAQEYGLPILQTVDLQGRFIDAVSPWRGLFVKDADPLIIEELQARGLLYKSGVYEHTYPFCWRCDTPLLYYAKSTWYIATTRYKEQLIANNQQINWYPEHIKEGRFGNWLENNVDWALGRDRYWGTPLPIWVCDQCGHQECIGSVAELSERAGIPFRLLRPGERPGPVRRGEPHPIDLHRPYIDEITWRCQKCQEGTMRRVLEVADCWFDSGSMPVAQWHYPFENQELFAEQFPADFICEAVDQTRGWFYTLHAVSTLLFNQPCYRNVVCLGLILDEKGQKMSKSRGNVVDPWDVLNAHGADALRWYLYTATPPGNSRRFSVDLVGEVVRKFLLTLWNTYSFFVNYANIDSWVPGEQPPPKESLQPLDRWILSELNQLVVHVTERLDRYDVTSAARAIGAFVDDLSNWYVRRSRRRFWSRAGESEQSDEAKNAAYHTLYTCLVTLSHLLAPFTPFISEAIYQNLVRSVRPDAPESVHLADWPQADEALIDRQLMADVRLAQRIVRLGHAARQAAQIKVRQPLSEVVVRLRSPEERAALERVKDQIIEELNVKSLRVTDQITDLVEVQIHLLPAKVGPKYGALFPRLRAAVAQQDQFALAERIQAGQPITLEVGVQTVELQPDEVEVRTRSRPPYSAVEEAGYAVAINTTLTPELEAEGDAREVVRHIQELRKRAGLQLSDRIITYVQGHARLARVLAEFGDYVAGETLSVRLEPGQPPTDAPQTSFSLNGEQVSIGITRVPEGDH